MKFGVPIIAMPMKVDQPLNAKIVEYIGIGMEAARDEDGKLQRKEIAKAIRKVVVEESGEAVRKIAKELSWKMKAKRDEEIDGVGLAVMSISNHGGPKHPYLSGNHAPNSYDRSNAEETQYNGNMVKNHMKTIMGNNVPQSQLTSRKSSVKSLLHD
ncbi:Cyanidin-3-O-glucoside 2-O-glucuronosyltransferase [Capsicum baccatum]|uniref:Cyanidin-3-O-glucoside 2-O-glucuronosyltransferase n=1 Tax=Capsicum baccatum TaxID=33114 RepID=A0A2G2VEU6_CAPBA|nr:Cyanidin-3-O-glucoside 2-O-glucuronosyltransferase [Capsicum baccatum]